MRYPLTQDLVALTQQALADGSVAVTRCPTRAVAPTHGVVLGVESETPKVTGGGRRRPGWKAQLGTHRAVETRFANQPEILESYRAGARKSVEARMSRVRARAVETGSGA